ncbi:peptidoglycan D,D-transpeptidase FtsI family protein [Micrococcoides hystricis]|uniref:Peptidoglycan D,D-transpeptidase FtsI family protein n=1 Tax=Micrococcoides hystricis TaxID=1572761 RepID=A0ABV6PBH7_9MICC
MFFSRRQKVEDTRSPIDKAIGRTWRGTMVLFVALFAALSYIQVIGAPELNANSWNFRTMFKQFDSPRGAILVSGDAIAESVPSDGEFDYQRVYRDPMLYSGLTGFYSLSHGTSGLEAAMNDELSGQSDAQFFDRFSELLTGDTMQGAQVELTINKNIQQLAYDTIPNGVRGTVVVTEVKTGNVVAMVSKPSYDTNELAVQSTAKAQENMKKIMDIPGLSPYNNRATSALIAPGSTFKIIDTVAALETGDYDKDTELENPDRIRLPGTQTTVPNFHGGICSGRPEAPLSFVFAQSCNTPFIQMAQDLGDEKIRKTAENFGFGEQFKIPLDVTASSFPAELNGAELGLASIGQHDVKVTPLQMNMVAAAIANEGKLMKPNLIKAVRGKDLKVLDQPKPKEIRRATSAKVAEQVKDLMVGVVNDRGTGYPAASNQFTIAAKTGTAELGGDSSNVNSWITGFAPADDPQYAVTLVFEDVPYERGHTLTSPNLKRILEAVVKP